MLQPRSYPELIGKALMLEADPFIVMVDDDNPWVEGLFMIVVVGVAVGAAHLVGGLLAAASLPPAQAVFQELVQAWRQLNLEPAVGKAWLQEAWGWLTLVTGYGSGWFRLLALLTVPLGLLIQWVFAGLVSHGVALALDGRGSLNQMLGASALMVAPQVLRLVHIVPFTTVSNLLLTTWALLVLYRAVAVAHELPWQRAVVAALAPVIAVIFLAGVAGTLLGLFLILGGGR